MRLVQRLSHIGLCVIDLDASKKFYTDLFDFTQVAQLEIPANPALCTLLQLDDAHIQAVFLERDNTRLELLYFISPPRDAGNIKKMNQAGLTHLSFRVQEIDTLVARIEEAGGKYLAETRTDNPQHMSKVCFVLDPNGVRIELIEAPGDFDKLPGQQ